MRTLEIGYDDYGVTHMGFVSSSSFIVFGQLSRGYGSNKLSLEFSVDEQPVGFFGTEKNRIE